MENSVAFNRTRIGPRLASKHYSLLGKSHYRKCVPKLDTVNSKRDFRKATAKRAQMKKYAMM